MLQCSRGHKWNTTFDIRHSDLKPGDKCPLEIGWTKQKKIKLCGCVLFEIPYEKRKEKKIKSEYKREKRYPKPYNRAKIKREGMG